MGEMVNSFFKECAYQLCILRSIFTASPTLGECWAQGRCLIVFIE